MEVRTSSKRKKTATAFWQSDRIVVVLPQRLAAKHREEMIDSLVRRVLAHRPHATTGDGDLSRRAAALADRYLDGIRPSSVRWVSNQFRRWGSCTPSTREIRISTRLRPVPDWVLDAVLVHELTHLIEIGHTRKFDQLANRYPRMADADLFLEGYHLGLDQLGARQDRTSPRRRPAVDASSARQARLF